MKKVLSYSFLILITSLQLLQAADIDLISDKRGNFSKNVDVSRQEIAEPSECPRQHLGGEILELPEELLLDIFSYLNSKDLPKIHYVNKLFYTIAYSLMENNFKKLRTLSVPSLAAKFKLVDSLGDKTWRSTQLKGNTKMLPTSTLMVLNKYAILREVFNSGTLIIELSKGKSQKDNQPIKYFSGAVEALKKKHYTPITSWQEEAQRVYPSLNVNFNDLSSLDKMYPTGQGITLAEDSYGYSLIKDGGKLIYNLCIDHLFQRNKAKSQGKTFQYRETPLHKFWQEYAKPVLLAESKVEIRVDEEMRPLLTIGTDQTWKREVYPVFKLMRKIKRLN